MAVEAGRNHVVLTEAETEVFLETLAPVQDRWVEEVTAKGVDGAALVERAKALIAEHSD